MKFTQALAAFIVLMSTAAASLWAIPTYKVWQQEMSGKARLAEASQSRKILVEQANAELEAAAVRAEAIGLVGKAAQLYPEYRQQEFMAAMGEALNNGEIEQMIYVPTEANIPITEASRIK